MDRLQADGPRRVHVITIATKPNIVKQYPVIDELLRRDELVLVCHTGRATTAATAAR